MNERTTNHNRTEEKQEAYSTTEATDSQGMGENGQWDGVSRKISNSSPYSIPMEEGLRARGTEFSVRQKAQSGSQDKAFGGRKQKAKRSSYRADQGINAFKKRDELGLSNRRKGSVYSRKQRQRIVQELSKLNMEGMSKSEILKTFGVCRSTYYNWLNKDTASKRLPSVNRLTESEKQAVIEKKKQEPQMSHRTISGILRHQGFWISPSSCYRILKSIGWVFSQVLREAPWKVPHYEPFRPNQIWGEDWTILKIVGIRHYLLTIIDYFSRYIIAWGIVKTVNQKEVQDILALAYMSEGIEHQTQKPIIRFDQGSPNKAHNTKKLIKDLEMIISMSRAYRPTDNSRQERWYRTAKQEEIYCYCPDYPSIEIAYSSMSNFINFYNEERPNQALWNFTPGFVHRSGNKTQLLKHYKKMVENVKEQRIRINQIYSIP